MHFYLLKVREEGRHVEEKSYQTVMDNHASCTLSLTIPTSSLFVP